MSKSRDERIKLQANYLNGLAIAVLAIGGIAPLASVFYGTAAASSPIVVFYGVAICILCSFALHWMAKRTLGGLDNDDT